MKQKSFTINELLVVISIIALLTSIVLVSIKEARDKARIARARQFSASIHHALDDDAVGVWSFDDGTAKDWSGNKNDGELIGPPTPEDGIIRGALKFASGDYVSVCDIEELGETNAITVEVWIKPDSSTVDSPAAAIVCKKDELLLATRRPGIPFFCLGNNVNVCFWAPIRQVFKAKKWHHFVGTYNGSDMRVFVDGVEYAEPKSAKGTLFFDSGIPLEIGRGEECRCGDFVGIIDEVRVYPRPLLEAQIQKHYVEGAIEKGLLAKE